MMYRHDFTEAHTIFIVFAPHYYSCYAKYLMLTSMLLVISDFIAL